MYEGQVGQFSGTTLAGTYAVERLIGRGGTGEVYQGHHTRTLRRVAIKILYPHLADDQTQLARFQREAEIAGKLGSDHIVQVLDVDSWHGQPYLVMELLEGETLDDRIARDRALPLALVGDVVGQVASALDRAHAAGVVHRDLKPQNIFLVASPDAPDQTVAKILDFGASKIHSAATALTHEVGILGTPTFMSPEQTRASGEVDQATDVFALGAITYNMLTGVRPFHGATIPAVLSQINHGEPPPIDNFRTDLPAGLADVVAIAMAKRIDQRYPSVADFSRDFAAALAGDLPDQVRRRAADLERGALAPSPDGADAVAPPGDTVTAVD
jgi:serine/threonine-protein kinase